MRVLSLCVCVCVYVHSLFVCVCGVVAKACVCIASAPVCVYSPGVVCNILQVGEAWRVGFLHTPLAPLIALPTQTRLMWK